MNGCRKSSHCEIIFMAIFFLYHLCNPFILVGPPSHSSARHDACVSIITIIIIIITVHTHTEGICTSHIRVYFCNTLFSTIPFTFLYRNALCTRVTASLVYSARALSSLIRLRVISFHNFPSFFFSELNNA